MNNVEIPKNVFAFAFAELPSSLAFQSNYWCAIFISKKKSINVTKLKTKYEFDGQFCGNPENYQQTHSSCCTSRGVFIIMPCVCLCWFKINPIWNKILFKRKPNETISDFKANVWFRQRLLWIVKIPLVRNFLSQAKSSRTELKSWRKQRASLIWAQ